MLLDSPLVGVKLYSDLPEQGTWFQVIRMVTTVISNLLVKKAFHKQNSNLSRLLISFIKHVKIYEI